jgi:hypothetical protein
LPNRAGPPGVKKYVEAFRPYINDDIAVQAVEVAAAGSSKPLVKTQVGAGERGLRAA